MQMLLKQLLLCLLVALPSISKSQTVTANQLPPVQAVAESTFEIYGQTYVRPAGTGFEDKRGQTTHPWWFSITNAPLTPVTATNYNVVYSDGPDTATYDSFEDYGSTTFGIVPEGDAPTPLPPKFHVEDFDLHQTYVSELTGEAEFHNGAAIVFAEKDGVRVRKRINKWGWYESVYTEHLDLHTYDDGSVKKHINDLYLTLIDGHDGSDGDLALYSTQDHSATNYVRNTNSWAYPLDLTCCSPWNSTGDPSLAATYGVDKGQFRPATAITKRHVLSSNHYHMRQTWSGSDTNFVLRFVTKDNEVIERTAIDHIHIKDVDETIIRILSPSGIKRFSETFGGITNWVENYVESDYVVLRLNEDLPDTILPAKRLPDNWLDYFPPKIGYQNYYNNQMSNNNYPLVLVDRLERATIGETWNMGLGSHIHLNDGEIPKTLFRPPTRMMELRDTYTPWFRDKINGDSSSPSFLMINGQPVITATLTTPTSPWVQSVYCLDSIQAGIASFGDTNIWEVIDLSEFNTYEHRYSE